MRLLLSVALAATLASAADAQPYRYSHTSIPGTVPDGRFGAVIAGGDVNANGFDDLAIRTIVDSTPLSERFVYAYDIRVFFGAPAAPFAGDDASTADLVLTGGRSESFGYDVAVGDLNGDGDADLLVGAPNNGRLGDESGAVYVFCGGDGLDAVPDRVIYGTIEPDLNPNAGVNENNMNIGSHVRAGDVTGDGIDDLVAYGYSSGQTRGEAYVVAGTPDFCSAPSPAVEIRTLAAFMVSIDSKGEYEGFYHGDLTLGDVDGDGLQDLMVVDDTNTIGNTAVPLHSTYVFYSAAAPAARDEGDADVTFVLNEPGGDGGTDVLIMYPVAAGDLDGDGADELAFGFLRFFGGASASERWVYIHKGAEAFATVEDVRDADMTIDRAAGSVLIGNVYGNRSSPVDVVVGTLVYAGDGTLSDRSGSDWDVSLRSPDRGIVDGGTAETAIVSTQNASCNQLVVGYAFGGEDDAGLVDISTCVPFLLFPPIEDGLDACDYISRPSGGGIDLCQLGLAEFVLPEGVGIRGMFAPDPESSDPDNPDLIDVSPFFAVNLQPQTCLDPEAGCVQVQWINQGPIYPSVIVAFEGATEPFEVEVSLVTLRGQFADIGPVLIQPEPVDVFGSYDLYAYVPASGATVRLTAIEDRGEFNPTWAPFGPYVVHDVAAFGPGDAFLGQELGITNAATGASALLPGTDGGNDADWWPFGLLIAYDRAGAASGPDETVYLSAVWGGPRLALRADAVDPSWSPTGRYLAFRQPSDGSVRARDLLTGAEVVVAEAGQNPVWSPTGRAIAFSDGDDLWRVPVRRNGTPTGPAVAVTSGPALDSQPAWYPFGGRLAYQSDASGAIDLYAVPASGGGGSFLSGNPVFGDFDPAVYPTQDGIVAYAGYTDSAARLAAGTVDAPSRSVASLVAGADPEAAALAERLGAADPARLEAWLASLGGQAVATEAGAPEAFAVAAFPNPASAAATVRVSLPEAADLRVTVHDALGREVARLADGPHEAGAHALRWAADVPAGVYLVRVRAGGAEAVRRMTVVR